MSTVITMLIRQSWCAAAAISLLTIAGCSTGPVPAPSGPYADEFTQALDAASSDFERAVLADNEISHEEYVEAHQRWLECMEDSFGGSSAVQVRLLVNKDGLYEYSLYSPSGAISDDAQSQFDLFYDACSEGTIENIAGLYNSVATNPRRLPLETLVYECLQRAGLVPTGYSEADFKDDWSESLESGPTGPLPPQDERVADCIPSAG